MSSQESKIVQRLSNISGQMATITRFNEVPLAPPDAILGIPFIRYLKIRD